MAAKKKQSPKPVKNLGEALAAQHVCVVMGPGGVGKTTTAAAIGVGMAKRGLRVAVVTIDPAKRLADALGVDELGNEPQRVSAKRMSVIGVKAKDGGELWAMTLDSRRTFDDLIARLAPDEETRDAVLGNRIYRELASAVAGSQEFTAVAKLHELTSAGGFDLIVLDTPPSRNAIDFLDAPTRIANFFDGRALQILMRPAGLGLRLAGGGTGILMSVLKRITGVDLFSDLAGFFSAVGGMVDGFSEQAHTVASLLADERTTFAVVCSPEAIPVDEVLHLASELKGRGLSAQVAIANRVNQMPGAGPRSVRTKEAVGLLGDDLSGRLSQTLKRAKASAERDAIGLARLHKGLPKATHIEVPLLTGEVHDLDGLSRIEAELFA
jgi:anion-transporting  ArsA/GET3 family ATPase